MFLKIPKHKKTYFLVMILIILIIRHIININSSFYLPDYEFQSLYDEIHLPENEINYENVSKYTGLSPFLAREMVENGQHDKLLRLNKLYFDTPKYEMEYIAFPITAQERNNKIRPPMASLENGDILITYNTHTFDWRHGHAAIVVDAEKGLILEHMSIGNNSVISNASRWSGYPGFIILRHPDGETAEKAARYASDSLVNISYSIFAGLIDKDMSDDNFVTSSHCSHIVWQAYKAAGCDLDSNKGAVVTPKDIAMSDELRVVQIFGIDPDDYKERFLY